jgi:hypothetical protein
MRNLFALRHQSPLRFRQKFLNLFIFPLPA